MLHQFSTVGLALNSYINAPVITVTISVSGICPYHRHRVRITVTMSVSPSACPYLPVSPSPCPYMSVSPSPCPYHRHHSPCPYHCQSVCPYHCYRVRITVTVSGQAGGVGAALPVDRGAPLIGGTSSASRTQDNTSGRGRAARATVHARLVGAITVGPNYTAGFGAGRATAAGALLRQPVMRVADAAGSTQPGMGPGRGPRAAPAPAPSKCRRSAAK